MPKNPLSKAAELFGSMNKQEKTDRLDNPSSKVTELLGSINKQERKETKRLEQERKNMIMSIGQGIVNAIKPILNQFVFQSKEANNRMVDMVSNIRIDIPKPDLIVPKIDVPKAEVTVRSPDIKIPEIVMPDEMNIRGWVQLQGVDLDNPLPVQLRDANGKPVNFLENLTTLIGGGGGGGKIGLTDTQLRALSIPVSQVSGANWSTSVSGTVAVSGITGTLGAAIVDSGGAQYSGTNPVPVDGSGATQPISAAALPLPAGAATSAKQLADDHNVTVSGVTDSTTAIIGDKAADEVDGDSNPIKVGGVARTANPSAVADGDRVSASYDDVGRQLMRPVQVRDLLQTAYVEENEIDEVVLLAGTAGVYHDLVYMMCANSSDAAITLDIRQTTGGTVQATLEIPGNATAGLALGGATIPQDHADATWTVQNNAADNSNTIYQVTALFSKEV